MNKAQMDTQLIEACLIEKWIPMKNDSFQNLGQNSCESCVLCQVYSDNNCTGCPISEATGKGCIGLPCANLDICNFLTNLLPPKHPWRNQSE